MEKKYPAELLNFPLHQPSLDQSLFDNISQVFFLLAGPKAVDQTAECRNTPVSVFPLNTFDLSVRKVGCAIEQVGKGLAVAVVVVVEQELWWVRKRFRFDNYLIPRVEGATILWNLVAEENWEAKYDEVALQIVLPWSSGWMTVSIESFLIVADMMPSHMEALVTWITFFCPSSSPTNTAT